MIILPVRKDDQSSAGVSCVSIIGLRVSAYPQQGTRALLYALLEVRVSEDRRRPVRLDPPDICSLSCALVLPYILLLEEHDTVLAGVQLERPCH